MGLWEDFANAFIWHTSEIDWCEANYEVSPLIAEFYNTISNLPFVIGSVVAMWLSYPYVPLIGYGPFLTYALLGLIGVGSMYFHATLSFAGQTLDEWGIIWVVAFCFYAYLPQDYMEAMGFKSQEQWGVVVMAFTAAITFGPYLLGPEVAFWVGPIFMCFTIMPVSIILKDASKNRNKSSGVSLVHLELVFSALPLASYRALLDAKSKALLGFSFVTFVLAVTCWVVDKLLCHKVHEWPIQLHAVWHILVYAAGHSTLTYLAYMRVVMFERERGLKPDIHFFPRKRSVGMPYLHIELPRNGESPANGKAKAS